MASAFGQEESELLSLDYISIPMVSESSTILEASNHSLEVSTEIYFAIPENLELDNHLIIRAEHSIDQAKQFLSESVTPTLKKEECGKQVSLEDLDFSQINQSEISINVQLKNEIWKCITTREPEIRGLNPGVA